MMVVEHGGLLTTVQDLGRPGLQHLGITPGGAMDAYSARLANLLVGNSPTSAVLEITLLGPRLRLLRGTWMALTGADLSAELDGVPFPTWRPVWVPEGASLRFGLARLGCRAYLAVGGGFAVAPLLGSRATDVRAGFGGLDGRPLRAGDRLDFFSATWPTPTAAARMQAPAWCVSWSRTLPLGMPIDLRLVPGLDWFALPPQGREALCSGHYRVGPRADRMGLRLEGPPLALPSSAERLSAGVAFGTLQLAADGIPILLGVDRQTVGGYPVLGTVARVDHPRLAQLRPGDLLRFVPLTPTHAQVLYRRAAAAMRRLEVALAWRLPLGLVSTIGS